MISALFFTWFAAAVIWTVNALRRPVPPHRRFPPLWLPGMLVSELAPWYLVARAVIAWGFIELGAADTSVGRAGIALFILSELGLLVLIGRTIVGARATGNSPGVHSLFKVMESPPQDVVRRHDVAYWGDLTLDIVAGEKTDGSPCLVYVHPGSWMRGRPGRQARALMYRLAQRGWVVLDIRYPLSPAATFPEHLHGVKRAIAWTRENQADLGVDGSRIVLSGGSSGAHLAALAALTADQASLQPGFEDEDTSVAAFVVFYGIYDLLVRNPTRYDWPFVARHVMKATPEAAPDLYRKGSPIDQVHAAAPPSLVIHGEFDSVVLAAESSNFAAALKSAGADSTYFEVQGAQHGFDAFASMRSRAVAAMCVAWLESTVRARARE